MPQINVTNLKLIYTQINNEMTFFRNREWIYVVLFDTSMMGTIMTFLKEHYFQEYLFWIFVFLGLNAFLAYCCVNFFFFAHSGLSVNRAIRDALVPLMMERPFNQNEYMPVDLFEKHWREAATYHSRVFTLFNLSLLILTLFFASQAIYNMYKHTWIFLAAFLIFVVAFYVMKNVEKILHGRGLKQAKKYIPMYCSMVITNKSKRRSDY